MKTPSRLKLARLNTDATKYRMECDTGNWYMVTFDFVKSERRAADRRIKTLEKEIEALLSKYTVQNP